MALHLLVQRPPRQLQLIEHRLDVAFMTGQRSAQALCFEGFLTRRQRVPCRLGIRLRQGVLQTQSLPFSGIGQLAHVAWLVMAQQAAQMSCVQRGRFPAHAFGGGAGEVAEQLRDVFKALAQRRQA